jgi:hypothetical protein
MHTFFRNCSKQQQQQQNKNLQFQRFDNIWVVQSHQDLNLISQLLLEFKAHSTDLDRFQHMHLFIRLLDNSRNGAHATMANCFLEGVNGVYILYYIYM